MIILVDACRSFVGRTATQYLLDQGHTVIDYFRDNDTPHENPNWILVHGQINDIPRLTQVLKEYKVDAILHLAAQSSPYVGYLVPLETIEANIMDTGYLLEAARMVGIKRVIMFSSDFGAGNLGIDTPVAQDSFPNPHSVYGVTKACCEYLARAYNYSYGMSCITLRVPHVYGSVRFTPEVLTDMVAKATMGEKYERPDGMATNYGFIHVEDLANLIELALKVPEEKVSEWAVYVGATFSTNMQGLLDTVKKYVPDFKYEVGPGIEKFNGVESELKQGMWDNSATTRDLGYVPKYNLNSGVKVFVDLWNKTLADQGFQRKK